MVPDAFPPIKVTDVIGQLFVSIFDALPQRYAAELAAVNDQYPFKPIRYQNPPLRFTWPQIIAMLREAGETIGDLDDISTPQVLCFCTACLFCLFIAHTCTAAGDQAGRDHC